ncbi:MAG: hypothetical protein CMQ15_14985 [Gammaproteobacteria bacterium]|jgi:hypothetical protein|nr:hypothetical protein [Gammaproteobacteria bacterium]HJN96903.1 hypothetical protein [Gammaproteobacteria bacterium]|tara:strand:+ start:3523 stop:3894 length:372 start_codon:yes stop_codon:yes gene_type:complete
MLKPIISILAALGFTVLAGTAIAADNAAIVGAWNMEIDFQGQGFAMDLTITESEEGLAGSLGAPEFGNIPLENVSFDGENLKFETDDQQGGTATAELKLNDNKLDGNISGSMGNIPAYASRRN